MTNYEKYKDQIIERLSKVGFFGVNKGKIKSCDGRPCYECDFNEPSSRSCSDARRAWLNAEATNTLTSDERKLCELLKTGYIAQDEDGDTWYFVNEPYKDDWAEWCSTNGECIDVKEIFGLTFKGMHDIKAKAWRVEDLLALEVCD